MSEAGIIGDKQGAIPLSAFWYFGASQSTELFEYLKKTAFAVFLSCQIIHFQKFFFIKGVFAVTELTFHFAFPVFFDYAGQLLFSY